MCALNEKSHNLKKSCSASCILMAAAINRWIIITRREYEENDASENIRSAVIMKVIEELNYFCIEIENLSRGKVLIFEIISAI